MLVLPESTEFNKRIPKQKFYEKVPLPPAVKKAFTEQVKKVTWRSKLAANTMSIEKGEQVTEIEVFHVLLNGPDLPVEVLRLIDRAIPYHILFLLECDGRCRAVIGYKEVTGPDRARVQTDRYYATDWMKEEDLPLHLEGLTLDAVYENFVRQTAGDSLAFGGADGSEGDDEVSGENGGEEAGECTSEGADEAKGEGEGTEEKKKLTLKESIELQKRKEELEQEIARLEGKMRRERQLNRKMEMRAEVRKLKGQVDALNGGC